jgi:two-component sensor histidine kinase
MPLRFLDDFGSELGSALHPDFAVAESEHRIANNLAIIAGMIRVATDRLRADPKRDFDAAISVLDGISIRIEAIAQLHRLLMEQPGHARIDLPRYLGEVIKAANSALAEPGNPIGFEARAEFAVHARIAAGMGLFLSEAVTNARKHANGARIRVVLRMSGQDLMLEVADDGPGLPSGFAEARASGFTLMRSLASRLDGRIEFDHGGGAGLCVRLAVPAE